MCELNITSCWSCCSTYVPFTYFVHCMTTTCPETDWPIPFSLVTRLGVPQCENNHGLVLYKSIQKTSTSSVLLRYIYSHEKLLSIVHDDSCKVLTKQSVIKLGVNTHPEWSSSFRYKEKCGRHLCCSHLGQSKAELLLVLVHLASCLSTSHVYNLTFIVHVHLFWILKSM